MLAEVVDWLQPSHHKIIVDCTFGGGGHSRALLEAGARVIGFDQDQDAIDQGNQLKTEYPNLELIKANFATLRQELQRNSCKHVDGILLDLGVSSHQLDEGQRGFSFLQDAELDMRMDQDLAVKAKDLIAALSANELEKLFRTYGDEPRAKAIAQRLVNQRLKSPIVTTSQLADLVMQVYHHRRGKLHPATKVFQALRIAVNDELNSLKQTLPQTIELLNASGRVVVISFHEGEDRITKQFMKHQEDLGALKVLTQKPQVPTEIEINQNPRARSAKVRVAEKIG